MTYFHVTIVLENKKNTLFFALNCGEEQEQKGPSILWLGFLKPNDIIFFQWFQWSKFKISRVATRSGKLDSQAF